MPGLYAITPRPPGTLISGLIYNSDHQNHVDARNALIVQSFTGGGNIQLQTDPLPSAESLATDFSGELQRLRFVISAVKTSLSGGTGTSTLWYIPLTSPGFATIGARIARVTTLTVTNNTQTTIPFTGGVADFNSGVWSSGAATRFTAPSTGLYYVAASVLWSATNGAGRRELAIGVNGTFSGQPTVSSNAGVQQGSTWTQRQVVYALLRLAATNYVEFAVYQDSGPSQSLISDASPAQSSIVGSMVFFGTAA